MKAKQRTLIILLICVLAACAALALLTRKNADDEQAASAAEEGTIPLSSFAASDLSSITYTYNGETLTLNYSGGEWTLEDDPEYHLDSTACNTMVTALSALNAKRQLEAEAGEDYGLNEPAVTVTVTAAGETDTFSFGAENSVTGDIYLQKAGDEAVYTVAASKVSCFEVSKSELFGAFSPSGLTASDIETVSYTVDGTYSVKLQAVSEPSEAASSESGSEESAESGADSEAEYTTVWRLSEEPDAELDETKVNSMLSALGSYVSGQITNADRDALGIAEPLTEVEATGADGTVRLAYYSGTDGYYLIVDGDSSVYQVDETTVQAFAYTAEELMK